MGGGDDPLRVGPEAELPADRREGAQQDAGGQLGVIPGLVDCHTHLAFGGWRADEFERRLQGATYLEIARAGGGIMSTVRATRAAGDAELRARAAAALDGMRRLGVTTVECKSGYGLDLETELRLLRVYRALAAEQPTRLVPTFLGAHVVPAEHRDDRAAYLRRAARADDSRGGARGAGPLLRRVRRGDGVLRGGGAPHPAGGEGGGTPPKLHADQLSAGGGPNWRPRWGR